MELEPIIQALRARCPVFQNRVAGAMQFKPLPEAAALDVPCAFVIPLDDNPQENQSQTSTRQILKDSFAVIVAVSNKADERGQTAAATVHTLRAALWSALLGWQPDPSYDGIVYDGGQIFSLDRARLWYQFEFGADMQIDGSDGWQETALAALPHLDRIAINLDAIQTSAPDGHIDVTLTIPKTGNLP